MKQKDTSNTATKQDLQNFEIKFDKKLADTEQRLRLEIRLANEETTTRILEAITKFKDLILTTIDPLLRELETRKQDRELATHQFKKLEERVEKLEQTYYKSK